MTGRPHVCTVRSTKPGRAFLYTERCECDRGDAHGRLESPDKHPERHHKQGKKRKK